MRHLKEVADLDQCAGVPLVTESVRIVSQHNVVRLQRQVKTAKTGLEALPRSVAEAL